MRRLTTKEFITRAKEVHDDKYDYSKVVYVNSTTKVIIICPVHGEFPQTPGNHPARVSYLQTVEPVVDVVANGITAMLVLESAKPLEGRTSLALISDLRHAFDAGERALENALTTGDTADERRFRTYLQQTLVALADIQEQKAKFYQDRFSISYY